MIARKISDVRKFMSGFLIGNMLDNFRLAEAVITTFCTFTIDGRLERRFFGEAEETDDQPENAKNRGPADLVAWKDVRERCFDLIRGKRTPLFFRFVFFSSAESASALLRQNGLALPEGRSPASVSISGTAARSCISQQGPRTGHLRWTRRPTGSGMNMWTHF